MDANTFYTTSSRTFIRYRSLRDDVAPVLCCKEEREKERDGR